MLWLKVSFPDLVDGFAFFFVQRRRYAGSFIYCRVKPLPCFGVLVCCSCCFHWRGSWGGWRNVTLWLMTEVFYFQCYMAITIAKRDGGWCMSVFLPFERRIRCFSNYSPPWIHDKALSWTRIAINLWLLHDNSCYDLNTNCHQLPLIHVVVKLF